MSETMRRLRQDHANLSRLLAALERQVIAMERGDKADWDIVQRIVDYCLAYPDLHHHPLEDQVLAQLLHKDPAMATPFVGLVTEHQELSASLRRVAAVVEEVVQDETVPRDWFIGLVRKFLDAQRNHIRQEDSGFYPTAERVLSASDCADFDRSASALATDPVFDKPTSRQYLALLSDIKAWEAAETPGSEPDGARL